MRTRVHRPALVALWVCAALLIPSPFTSAQSLEGPKPAQQFGGIYRRMLASNPATLDPATATDIYSRTIIHQGRPFLDAVIYKLGGNFEEEFAEFLKGNLEEAIVP